MNKDKVFLKGYVIGHAADTLGYKGLMVQLENLDIVEIDKNLLVYGLGINRYFFARTYDSSKRNEHTRKELEEAGFGWVFDCPGVEVEEVEE